MTAPRFSTAIRHMAHTSGIDAAIDLAQSLLNINRRDAALHVTDCTRKRDDVTHYEWSEKQQLR